MSQASKQRQQERDAKLGRSKPISAGYRKQKTEEALRKCKALIESNLVNQLFRPLKSQPNSPVDLNGIGRFVLVSKRLAT